MTPASGKTELMGRFGLALGSLFLLAGRTRSPEWYGLLTLLARIGSFVEISRKLYIGFKPVVAVGVDMECRYLRSVHYHQSDTMIQALVQFLFMSTSALK